MPVRSSFTAGEVLTAADLTDTFASKVDYATPTNAQSGTGASAYTFVLADASRLTTATGTSAKTFTIPPQANVAWVANSIIRVANYGTGDLTIAGGSGVTVTNASTTLAQFQSAALVRTGSNAWTLLPFAGGAGNADFSNTASGTYSDAGINYKWIQFTASATLTVTRAGLADVLVIGGGGSGGCEYGGAGGAGGHLYITDAYLPVGSLTVTVGAGGAGVALANVGRSGNNGNASRLASYYSPGGGAGAGASFQQQQIPRTSQPGFNGGSGGSSSGFTTGSAASSGSGVSGVGNNAGSSVGDAAGGGGGAGATGGNGSGTTGGAGGAGTANSITGSSVTRAGGGGGSATGTAGSGGSGGGGAGAIANANATSGTANTGGGGGGCLTGANTSGSGGSGVVIIRVKV